MSVWKGNIQAGLAIKEQDVVFYNVKEEPFSLYGFSHPRSSFFRMPDEVARNVSDAVASHNKSAAGGRVRFSTDSKYVAIRVKHAPYNMGMPAISRQGTLGIDMYIKKNGKEIYHGSFLPPVDMEDAYEGVLQIEEEGMHEITLCLPYIKQLLEVEVGVQEKSTLEKHPAYKYEKPVVFYGSSITQGISASRPGNSYENFISRDLDCNYYNLGFSGSAMGETDMAEFISTLDMSVFVMDYDHNAPDVTHLQKTHEPFFRIVREKKPSIPIILLTKPDVGLEEENQARRKVIQTTYQNAVDRGDCNVYYIDGYTCFPEDCRKDCTVDGCHPNDLGMYYIAKRISKVLEGLLQE